VFTPHQRGWRAHVLDRQPVNANDNILRLRTASHDGVVVATAFGNCAWRGAPTSCLYLSKRGYERLRLTTFLAHLSRYRSARVWRYTGLLSRLQLRQRAHRIRFGTACIYRLAIVTFFACFLHHTARVCGIAARMVWHTAGYEGARSSTPLTSTLGQSPGYRSLGASGLQNLPN